MSRPWNYQEISATYANLTVGLGSVKFNDVIAQGYDDFKEVSIDWDITSVCPLDCVYCCAKDLVHSRFGHNKEWKKTLSAKQFLPLNPKLKKHPLSATYSY
jgi:sulfatase maturation enzyme AslB (radical SAM superfamily)